jgi:DNA-binding NarL/FixJ family response regulator
MTGTTGFRILLADDHAVVLKGLRALLGSQLGWRVCGEARNGREAIEKVSQLRPDIVIMDLNMPELNGLEAARHIRKELPQTEVLILTLHESEQMMRQALDAGARGYVVKSDAGGELVAAVEAVRRHRLFLSSRASQMLGEPSTLPARGDVATREPLSPGERQIPNCSPRGAERKKSPRHWTSR